MSTYEVPAPCEVDSGDTVVNTTDTAGPQGRAGPLIEPRFALCGVTLGELFKMPELSNGGGIPCLTECARHTVGAQYLAARTAVFQAVHGPLFSREAVAPPEVAWEVLRCRLLDGGGGGSCVLAPLRRTPGAGRWAPGARRLRACTAAQRPEPPVCVLRHPAPLSCLWGSPRPCRAAPPRV